MVKGRGVGSGLLSKRRAQVWVETVIYTLIALTIIGVFLSFAKPKVEEIQDKAIIDQSIGMLEDINRYILMIVEGGEGNRRVIDVGINKGSLLINSSGDQIIFEIDGRYTYSEPGEGGTQGDYISVGNILATTRKIGQISTVTLISNYSSKYNITYQNSDKLKVVSRSPAPYKFALVNRGDIGGTTQIDISIV